MKYPGEPIGRNSRDQQAVRAIQRRLNEAASAGDPQLDVDGDFGPRTLARVKLFQARGVDSAGRPLAVDGIVGRQTWAALFGVADAPAVGPAGPLLEHVLRVARQQVGVMEQPPGSNRGPMVDQYIRAGGLYPERGSYPWCAAFLCWVFAEAAKATGVANPLPRTAGVMNMWRKIGGDGLLRVTAAQARANPELVRPGMLFFLSFSGGLGHVGLVVQTMGSALVTIEGNTTQGTGSREGVGVFERDQRRIRQINLGFADVTRRAA